MPRKTKDTANLRLRVEPELLAKLETAREKHGRTLSGEIIRRLELSFARERNRATAFDNAATILELVADTLRPDLPPAEAQQHLRKVLDSMKRIASQLREEQERA
jgi:hypothetical protein